MKLESRGVAEVLQPGALVDGGEGQLAADTCEAEGVRFFRTICTNSRASAVAAPSGDTPVLGFALVTFTDHSTAIVRFGAE